MKLAAFANWRKNLGPALVIGGCLASFALIGFFKIPRVYEAVARIQIDRESGDLLKIDKLHDDPALDEATYLETQCKNLGSRSLIQSVVDQLRLGEDTRYAQRSDVIQAVANDITIAPIPYSRLVDIKVRDLDPKKAAAIANSLVQTFRRRTLDFKLEGSVALVNVLHMEAEGEEMKLHEAEKDLAKFSAAHKLLPPKNGENPYVEAALRAQTELSEAKFRTLEASDTLAALERHKTEGKTLANFPLIADDSSMSQAQLELARLELEAATASTQSGISGAVPNPNQERLAAARLAVDKMAQLLVDSFKSRAELARAAERRKESAVQEWEGRVAEWNEHRAEYELLRLKAESTRDLYGRVLARMREVQLTSRNTVDNIAVIDAATVPMRPVSPLVYAYSRFRSKLLGRLRIPS